MNKKIYAALFACMLCANAFTQPVVKAQKDLGGSKLDYFTTMALTKDGGRIAGGYSLSNISGNKTENSRGDDDYWVVKLDASNKIEWDKTIGGSDIDIMTSLQQTNDGGYILGGFSYSNASGEKTQNKKGSSDYWIVKLDSLGNVQFDRTIGGSSIDQLNTVEQTRDGGYILGGYSESNKSGNKTEDSKGAADYWIVKLSAKGNIQWDKTIGGSDEDFFSALQQTTDGGYILGGTSFSEISGDKTESNKGFADFWVVKIDSIGNIQFDKTIGGNSTDNLSALQQTKDGGYILGGHSFSNISGNKTENSRGFADYWIVKLNSTGNIQFDKTIGGNDLDILSSIEQTTDGGFVLGGRSFSNISFEKTENTRGINDDDYWVVKLDRNGNKEWDKTIGGTQFDECYSVKETATNRYVAGGFSLSNTSGDKTTNTKGERDYWLVDIFFKPGSQTSTTTAESITAATIPSSVFSAYPNPAKDVLHVRNNNSAKIILVDASGKTVRQQTITGNTDINVSNLQPGIYFLKNETTGEQRKIMIVR